MITHDWQITSYTTPSGKLIFQCSKCKLIDIAPVKEEFERRPCDPEKYIDQMKGYKIDGNILRVIPMSKRLS